MLLLALGLALPSLPAHAAFGLHDLMALFAQRTSGQARFTEERFVSGLDAPLVARGTLAFEGGRFTRRTLQPRAETMEVAGNTLTLTRGGRSRSVALDAVPELAAFIDALRGTLGGDARVLQRHFDAHLTGDASAWTLELTPLPAQRGGPVQSMRLAGQGAELRNVQLQLAGGDHSVMMIEPIAGSDGADAAPSPAPPAPAASASRP